MMDKMEPPAVADGYGLSVAFVCMLDIVKSIHSLVGPVADSTTSSNAVDVAKPAAETDSTSDTGTFCMLLISEACYCDCDCE